MFKSHKGQFHFSFLQIRWLLSSTKLWHSHYSLSSKSSCSLLKAYDVSNVRQQWITTTAGFLHYSSPSLNFPPTVFQLHTRWLTSSFRHLRFCLFEFIFQLNKIYNFQAPVKNRDASVQVRETWQVVEDMDFPRLSKLSLPGIEPPEDLWVITWKAFLSNNFNIGFITWH